MLTPRTAYSVLDFRRRVGPSDLSLKTAPVRKSDVMVTYYLAASEQDLKLSVSASMPPQAL